MDNIESEKCPHCGVPAWHAYSDDNTITFKHREVKCEACAFDAVESKKSKEPEPGVRKVVQAIPEEGFGHLPGREDWYEREYKKLMLKAKRAAEQAAREAAA